MPANAARRLKVEFHLHTSADPVDSLPLDLPDTIELAAARGFDAICVTHHEMGIVVDDAARAASERTGVLVIPGIEASLDGGAHMLVINCGREAEDLRTLDDLARFRRPEHLVIAPHAYYPGGVGLARAAGRAGLPGEHGLLERALPLLDAVEWSHYWHPQLDRWNRKAHAFARAHGLPLVGTGDVHLPDQLGTTYTLVEAERDTLSIVEAVRSGRVEVVTRPLSLAHMASIAARLALRSTVFNRHLYRRLGRALRRLPRPARAGA